MAGWNGILPFSPPQLSSLPVSGPLEGFPSLGQVVWPLSQTLRSISPGEKIFWLCGAVGEAILYTFGRKLTFPSTILLFSLLSLSPAEGDQ